MATTAVEAVEAEDLVEAEAGAGAMAEAEEAAMAEAEAGALAEELVGAAGSAKDLDGEAMEEAEKSRSKWPK